MAYPTDDVIETYARMLAAVGEASCWWGRMEPRLEECELCDCSGQVPHQYRMVAKETLPKVKELIEQTHKSSTSSPPPIVICSENLGREPMKNH